VRLRNVVRLSLITPFDDRSYYRPAYPSVGLGYLSSFLVSDGVEVLAIDAKFDGVGIEAVKKALLEFHPDIVGFSAMTHEICNAASWAAEIKRLFPEALIIIGGVHATVAAESTLAEFPVFDLAVIGEGEYTLREIADCRSAIRVLNVQILRDVKGIAWREDGEVRVNQRRDAVADLDSLPIPSYDHIRRDIKAYPILTSRGCPSKCIFCCRILGDRLRVREPRNVVDEIALVQRTHHPDLIEIVDDTFTLPRSRALEICKILIEEGLQEKVRWFALSRVSGVDLELFREMRAAGCEKVDFGVESGNEEILKRIRKGITTAHARNAVRAAKEAGLKTGSYFILGHPGETVETIQDTIDLAVELNTDVVSFGIMVPYPGTEVYSMAKSGVCGYRLLSENWDDYDKQIGNALEIEGLSRTELEKWQRRAYLAVYLRNRRFATLAATIISQRRLVLEMLRKWIKS
jgi:anaerobic magnesium-protoporphyrin IX monomethyl ester cyclase